MWSSTLVMTTSQRDAPMRDNFREILSHALYNSWGFYPVPTCVTAAKYGAVAGVVVCPTGAEILYCDIILF